MITGAGSRIGAALALGLARPGLRIWVHYYSNAEGAERTCDEIRRRGGAAEAVCADLRDGAGIERMFTRIRASGRLIGLIHCAAVFFPSRLDTLTTADWDELFSVNLRGAWLTARTAGAVISEDAHGGWIILFSDSGARQDWTSFGGYVLTKQAILGLTRLMAKTFAPRVRVNAISPGLILKDSADGDRWSALSRRTLLERPGEIDDLLQAVRYLIGAAYVTGTELIVDGGYRFRRGADEPAAGKADGE